MGEAALSAATRTDRPILPAPAPKPKPWIEWMITGTPAGWAAQRPSTPALLE